EDFDGSDAEKEGDNNVSMVPDSVTEDANVQAEEKVSIPFPPGFTPCDEREVECDKKSVGNNEGSGFGNEKGESVSIGLRKSNKIDIKRTGAKKDWVKEICVSYNVNFLTLQETKMEDISLIDVKCCWGNYAFEYAYSPKVGNSGGILCVWEKSAFKKNNSKIFDYFVMLGGSWLCSGVNLLIISVYAPQEYAEKKMLWDYLVHVISKWDGEVIVMGDFNEVRFKNERFGSSEKKMSKLNRFLMSEGLLGVNPNFSDLTLDRMYHYWFEIDRFDEMISKAWCECPIVEVNPIMEIIKDIQEAEKVDNLEAA
nr:RNA-directed DNA polymerase, eukaryota [Tanacetum cinerariifolium]